MTSSNKTYRKSRLFTGLAIGTALLATGVFGYLFMRVNSLETEFGDLRANRARIESDVKAANVNLEGLKIKIDTLSLDKKALQSDVLKANQKKAQLTDILRLIVEKQKMLDSLTGEEIKVKNLIADKDNIAKALADLRRSLSEVRAEKNGLTTDIRRLKDEKARAEQNMQDAVAEQKKVQGKVTDLEQRILILSEKADGLGVAINEKTQAEKARDKALNEESAARSRATEQVRLADAAERRLKQATDNLKQVETTLSTKGLEKGRLETEVGGLEQQIKGLTKQVGSLRTDKNQIKGALDSVKTQIKDENTLLENAKSDLAATQRDLADTEKSLSITQASLGTAQNSLAGEQKKLAATQIKRAAEEERLVTVTQKVKAQEKHLNELGNQIAGAGSRKKTVNNELATIKAEVEGERQALDTARKNRLAAEAEESGIRASIIEAKKQISYLQDALSSLIAKIDGQKAKESKAREKADSELKKLAIAEGKVSALQSLIPTLELQKAALEGAVNDLKQRKAVLEPLPEAVAPPANTSGTSGPSKGGNN